MHKLLGLQNSEVGKSKSCFSTEALKNKQKLSGITVSESQRPKIYRNEVNIESIKSSLVMIGLLCGVYIYAFSVVLKTATHIPRVEPWKLISEGKADFRPNFLHASIVTFLGLCKRPLQDAAHPCYT